MKANAQAEQMRDRIWEFYAREPEECLGNRLLRAVEDPLRPRDEHGRFRPNPILVLLTAILALAAGTFLFFSLGG
jgi:hypothetical protein